MKVFYHNDADGKCSAFWVFLHAGLHINKYNVNSKFQAIGLDIKDTFPLDIIDKDEQIYIVDYSISPEEMEKVLKITQDVTWIDHHITAIDKYKDFKHEIRGIRKDGVAASMLTYCYLEHMTSRGEGKIKKFIPKMCEDAPYFVKLIADYDVWAFRYGDETKHFHLGFEQYDFNPESNLWFKLFDNQDETHSKLLYTIINEGKTIQKYKKSFNEEYLRQYGFNTNFEGLNCFALNIGMAGSENFECVIGDYDMFIAFCYDGEKYKFSLRSKNIDTSAISVKYGGGGHKLASGFILDCLPFKKI